MSKTTKDILIAENKRLKELLLTWQPPQVADSLRREMDRLKNESDTRSLQRFELIADSLAAVAVEMSQEMKKYRAFEARKQAGIVGKVKRVWRYITRYEPASEGA